MPPVRWRTVLWITAVCLALVIAYVYKFSLKMPDFEVYWRAGVRAASGEALYRVEDGHYQFKYLPAFAVIVSPLSAVPEAVARATWFVVSLASVVGLIAVSLRLWPSRQHAAWVLILVTLVVMGKYYARELVLGQANAMFAVVMAGAVLALSTGREHLAGGLIALGIVLKPYGLILLPWVVARRRLESITTLGAGLVVAVLLPLCFYSVGDSVSLHEAWWATVRDSTAPNLLNPDNISWMAMYSRWFDGRPALITALWGTTMVAVAGITVGVWALRNRVSSPDALEGSLLLMLIPLVSPQGWDYVLLVATPAVMCLAVNQNRLERPLRVLTIVALALIGLTLYDVMGRTAYHAFLTMSGITLCAFVLIGALATLRARGVA